MLERSEIRGISVTLEVGDQILLFVHLDDAGNIQRLGNGETFDESARLVSGELADDLFRTLLGWVSDDLINGVGVYDLPDPAGQTCRLQLLFSADEERTSGLEFHYGTESEGPPTEVMDFVVTALDLTEMWYEAERVSA
jgi:hypothetical protein